MTDVTVLLMAEDSPVPDSPGRWRRGEIVDVFTLEQCPGPVGHPRHVHVHITGIPYAFERIKDRLTQGHDPDPQGENYRARRRFVVRADLIPAGARQRLIEDREITVTWEQVKVYAKKRRIGSLDPLDDVTDADFNNILLVSDG